MDNKQVEKEIEELRRELKVVSEKNQEEIPENAGLSDADKVSGGRARED